LFASEEIAAHLEPVFTTRVARRCIPLQVDESEVELAIDRGEIESDGRRLPIAEAELELLSGSPMRLYELALKLHDRIPFRLERRTKAARGYGLKRDERPHPVKAGSVQLSPEMTTAEGFATAARSCLAQVRANELVVLAGDDPEGIHQLRVGVRRLRAVLGAFRRILDREVRDYLLSELQWLQQRLGPAREWDVFIHEAIEPIRAKRPDATSLAELQQSAEAARSRGYRQAHRALTAGRYTALMLRLELWLDEGGWLAGEAPDGKDKEGGKDKDGGKGSRPLIALAAKVLHRRDRKLRKLAEQHRELSEPEMHSIRIKAKQMRYSVEVFQSLYPAKLVKRQLLALEAIQDALGSLNDAVVGRELLDSLLRAEARRDAARLEHLEAASEIVRNWQEARIVRDLKRFGASWKRYGKAKRYWEA
jgi:inorganic triphosphatase YgiF